MTPLGGIVKPRKETLTDQELEIMKVVWKRDSSTVRDVYEELLRHRKIAYTTVMTMMGILEQKGHLTRSPDGRAYVYRPAQPKAKVVGNMVQDFVKRVFDGSAEPLLVHLVENKELDEEQLKEIERLLKERRRKK
jgi:BlaI family penicillinase repressor